MGLKRILPALARAHSVETALDEARHDTDFAVVEGVRIPLLAELLEQRDGPTALLVITATSRESESVQAALSSYLPEAHVLGFPAWETLPHERLSPSAETVGARE